ADQIPTIALADGKGTLELVSGTYNGITGPIRSLTGVFMSTVRLASGARVQLLAPQGRSVFLYVVSGTIAVAGSKVEQWHLVTLNDDGDEVAIQAVTDVTLLFGHADPIGEPVVAQGPFVMNSQQEISEAIRDYQAGKFNGTGPLIGVGE
ncbi:MAG: pirin family protein, partial [Oxalobacteraceae bacterium]